MRKRFDNWRFVLGNILIIASGSGLAVGHVVDPLFRSGLVSFVSFVVFLGCGTLGLLLLGLSIRSIAKVSRRHSLLADMNIEINRALLLDEDIDLIYDTILDYLFRIFDHVEYGSILVLDESGALSFAASRGFSPEYVAGFKLRLEDSFLYKDSGGKIEGARLISKRTLDQQLIRPLPDDWRYRSVISAPLHAEGRLFGLLNLDSHRPRTFVPEDVRIVERFTAQIEVCLLARGQYTKSIARSRTDALTGLYTRRYFEELFQIELARTERYGEEFTLGLFDADGLKKVNDSLGHQAGDRMLSAIADALREGHRKSDIVGRFGGDEYIALYHSAHMESMRLSLEETLEKLESVPIESGEGSVRAAFSFGLAKYPDDGKTLAELTAAADGRLYEMKKRRRR